MRPCQQRDALVPVFYQMLNAQTRAVVMGKDNAVNGEPIGHVEKQYRHVAAGGGNGNGIVLIKRVVDEQPAYPLRQQVMYRRFAGVYPVALHHRDHHAGA